MRLNAEVLTLVMVGMPWMCGGRAEDPPRPSVEDGSLFDYVVVGAGASGSAVAARLTLAGYRVLLVEAGGDPGLLSKIPNAAMALTGTDIDWFYETIPNNKSCLSMRGRQCRFSRGRCLGGSTSINYMLYTRANPLDYNFGILGWSWRDLKPYFLRFEGLQSLNRLPPSSYPFHNTSGVVAIGPFDRSNNPWNQRIVKGLTSLNFQYNYDVNAQSQIGVSNVLGYVSRGERVSTATSYLYSREVRKKLTIASNMRCTGVIISTNNVALGVTAVGGKNNERAMKFYAKHEVILSAGTIGSAQLLMLSGIGKADHLQTLGIPFRVHLPVGDNMSDHVFPLMFIKVDYSSEAIASIYRLGLKSIDVIQWLTIRSGPLASLGVTDVLAFVNMKCYDFKINQLKDGPGCSIPSLQFIFAYVDRYIAHIAPTAFKQILGDEVFDQILAANANSAFLIVSPILLQPKSRGWIGLASKNPMASPIITPNYLDDEIDVVDVVKSIKIVERMVQTSVFKQHNASLLKIKFKGCPEVDQVGYWDCYVRHMTNSAHHAVGTVQLGKVVDERLRVRGIKRLRVGDVSVLPKIPRGNTAAAAIAIGERLADIVLEDQRTLC